MSGIVVIDTDKVLSIKEQMGVEERTLGVEQRVESGEFDRVEKEILKGIK